VPGEAGDCDLRLLKDALTGSRDPAGGGVGSRRRRGAALLMAVLLRRGLTVVPRMPATEPHSISPPRRPILWLVARVLAPLGFVIVPDRLARTRPREPASPAHNLRGAIRDAEREYGLYWPGRAETMVGRRRLDNVEWCVRDVLDRDVPGDLIETGVWRGGTTILMRAVLAQRGDSRRCVWVADSFQGLPKPDASSYPDDAGVDYTGFAELAVTEQQVRDNFARHGLLDGQVRFLAGWFRDTLPAAPIERLAVLRLDGDLYESTLDALQALYPKLSPGGYCIVDDYGALRSCRRAVDDYRRTNGITEELQAIDWTGAYWQRRSP
jgi:O-methyltransferase